MENSSGEHEAKAGSHAGYPSSAPSGQHIRHDQPGAVAHAPVFECVDLCDAREEWLMKLMEKGRAGAL